MSDACWCLGGRAAAATPLARFELVAGIAWFISDGSWLMLWRWPCYITGVLAVAAAIAVFFFQEERSLPAVLVAVADTSWLLFNIAWSFGEIAGAGWLVEVGKYLFFLGAALFVAAFWEGGANFVLGKTSLRWLFSRAWKGQAS